MAPQVGTTGTITYQGNGTDAGTIQTDLNNLLAAYTISLGSITVIQSGVGVYRHLFTAVTGTPMVASTPPRRVGRGVHGRRHVVDSGGACNCRAMSPSPANPSWCRARASARRRRLPLAGQWFAVGPAQITDGQTAGNGT